MLASPNVRRFFVYSREYNCFSKILAVCKNRGFPEVGRQILDKVAPEFISKTDLQMLKGGPIKMFKDTGQLTFFEHTLFDKECKKCGETVKKGDAVFIRAKDAYHVLCGLEEFGSDAKSNKYYNRWLLNSSYCDPNPCSNDENIEVFNEEEI